MITRTPLEPWIRAKAGIDRALTGRVFTDALETYQLGRLNDTIEHARENAPFYRKHLPPFSGSPLTALSDINRLPFTTARDLSANPSGFLAVRQDDVARIVTLCTSGSTGAAKRLFFTDADLELTMDFFHHGMSTLVKPGQRVAVLLPASLSDSVGDLLVRGLKRMDVESLPYGPVVDPHAAAQAIVSFDAHCLVGIPTQVLAVAACSGDSGIGKGTIETVLLSTDYCPRSIANTLERVWGCRVFTHYGLTETGLGGGVECEALDGYHLREADLYFEIVDHVTGRPCRDGMIGEVVFTTLTRQGMPLIRYRTGDIGRMIPERCPCGTPLRRMDRVKGRWDNLVVLAPGSILNLPDVDEKLFNVEGLLDYRVTVAVKTDKTLSLWIEVYCSRNRPPTEPAVLQALLEVDPIRRAVESGKAYMPKVKFLETNRWTTNGVAKRKIAVTG